MSQENQLSPTEKSGGLAFQVILKPASKLESPCLTPKSKSRLETTDIKAKLQQAQARKEALEAEKLQSISKNRARAQEAIARLRAEEEKIKAATLEKLDKKQGISHENKEQQVARLRERLRNHLEHVMEVCKKSSIVTSDLEERLKKKYEAAEEKRRSQIEALLAKLRDHATHIQDVCKVSEENAKVDNDKMIEKMEAALKRRMEQLQALHERLQEHEKHIQEVRSNKSGSGDCDTSKTDKTGELKPEKQVLKEVN